MAAVVVAGLARAPPPLFFLLGVARLLMLALPRTLVASPEVAIHAFSQVLVALVLVALLVAWTSPRSGRRTQAARRALQAIGVGLAVAVTGGGLPLTLVHFANGPFVVEPQPLRSPNGPRSVIGLVGWRRPISLLFPGVRRLRFRGHWEVGQSRLRAEER